MALAGTSFLACSGDDADSDPTDADVTLETVDVPVTCDAAGAVFNRLQLNIVSAAGISLDEFSGTINFKWDGLPVSITCPLAEGDLRLWNTRCDRATVVGADMPIGLGTVNYLLSLTGTDITEFTAAATNGENYAGPVTLTDGVLPSEYLTGCYEVSKISNVTIQLDAPAN